MKAAPLIAVIGACCCVMALTGCANDARGLYERAVEVEVEHGLEAAGPLYREVVLRYPATRYAELANAKLEQLDAGPERPPTPDPPHQPSMLLDIEQARVGALELDAPEAEIVEAAERLGTSPIGPVQTRPDIEYQEGMPHRILVVSFGGHELVRKWSGVEVADPVFRTRHGLGVGSTVGEFGQALGQEPAFTQERGQAAMFTVDGRALRLGLEWGCERPSCVVEHLWFTTQREL